MAKSKIVPVLFSTMLLSLGAGCATAEDMDSTMHDSGKGEMSGSTEDGTNGSGDRMDSSMHESDENSMSDSTDDSDHSKMSGSMSEDGSDMNGGGSMSGSGSMDDH